MTTLHLNIKQPWFSMEQSGEKTEEYRDIKDYWVRRLMEPVRYGDWDSMYGIIDDLLLPDNPHNDMDEFLWHWSIDFRHFESIEIKNGWARNGKPAPKFTRECLGIRIGIGRKEWGASGINQFIIILGEVVG